MKKKLQVFVSSTFTDLKDERQAAVEAILRAGHIPAGMELFIAGDKTQLEVIERWIEESDVYLLILGGRYGTLEPKSQKSYTHIEYEHAAKKGKPCFSVVLSEKHLDRNVAARGKGMIEGEEPKKLRAFRKKICSKIVRFSDDENGIKLAVMETLSELANRSDLVGWVPGSEAKDNAALATGMATLANENASLRKQLADLEGGAFENGLSYSEIYSLLSKEYFSESRVSGSRGARLRTVAQVLGDAQLSVLHAFWAFGKYFFDAPNVWRHVSPDPTMKLVLGKLGLFAQTSGYALTEDGKRFLLRMEITQGRHLPPQAPVPGDNVQADPFFESRQEVKPRVAVLR